MKNNTLYFITAITLLFVTATVIASWNIEHPGFYYDEVLFGNAAVGGKTDNLIRKRVMGIPVLLMSYIGALKAWIYYPIFSIFPVNYWTVRLPAIFIGITGGLTLVMALWRGFGRSTAIVGAVMILLDPTMLIHSRLDWGPNALMFLFRGILIFSFVSWIKTKNIKWAWIALAAGGIGIFDKLNFIWIMAAALCSLPLVYFGTCRTFARDKPRQALALSLIGGLGLLFAILRGIKLAEPQDIDWYHRIPYALGELRLTLSGGGALDFICSDGTRVEKWFWPGYILAILACIAGWRSLSVRKSDLRLYIWCISFMLLLTLAFILTKSATGPHHSAVLSGIWQLAFAPLVGAAWDDSKQPLRLMRRLLVAAAVTLIFAGNIIVSFININAYSRPTNSNWDPANTEAALFAKQHPSSFFSSVDWGIGMQVITLTKDNPGISDAWPLFTKQEYADEYVRKLPENKDIYIYTRRPGFENFKGNRAILINALAKNQLSYEVAGTWSDWKGRPMIELWHINTHKIDLH